jgi:hypothetical protein
VLTGLAAIAITLATVSVQAIRAALANPIESLRSEWCNIKIVSRDLGVTLKPSSYVAELFKDCASATPEAGVL